MKVGNKSAKIWKFPTTEEETFLKKTVFCSRGIYLF